MTFVRMFLGVGSFEHANIPNLEMTYLPQFFEGPVEVSNVTLADVSGQLQLQL